MTNSYGYLFFILLITLSLSSSFVVNSLICKHTKKSKLGADLLGSQLLHHASKDKDPQSHERHENIISSMDRAIPKVAALIATLALSSVPAVAFDRPADYLHLNIPLPILDVRYFIAGGLCAAASHGVATPIDVIKTRIQADSISYKQGFLDAAICISKEGDGALLRGLGPTVIGYGVEGAAKFGLYETLKPMVADILSLDSPAIAYLIASIVAGAAASLMLLPMEKARVRLVTDPSFASNLATAFPRLIDEAGVRGLFGGLGAMLSKQVPYTLAKQVSFDTIAKILYAAAINANFAAADVKFEVSFGAALLASMLACLLSHPGDVILTATFKASNPSFPSVVSQIYEESGTKGFFSGLSARFVHVGTIITSQLILYDILKQLLGLPATGT
jgi:solute carrier family 25 phosphate transporter 3